MEKEIIEETQDISEDNSNDNVSSETSDKDNSPNSDENESYKKRYSDSSRENTRIRQVHNSYRQVLKDNSHLLELDSDLAKDVVAQLYEDWYSDTDSYEELVEALKNGDEDNIDEESGKIDEDTLVKNIRAKILEENQEEEAAKVLKESLSKFDEDTKTKYLKEFTELVGKRKLTPDFAQREIDKIIVYNNRKQLKQDRDDDVLSKLASNNLWSSKETSKTTMTIAKLESLWMPKAQQRARYPELFTK